MNTEPSSAPADVPASAPDAPVTPSALPAVPEWAPPLPELADKNDLADVDPRSLSFEEQIALYERPAARPTEYQVVAHPDHQGSPEALAEVQGIQSLLYAANLPANEGSGLMEAIKGEIARNPDSVSDAEFELLIRSTELTLKQQLGEQEYQMRQTKLAGLLSDIDRKTGGKLAEYLEDHAHIIMQPMVYSRLLAHAARLDERRRG